MKDLLAIELAGRGARRSSVAGARQRGRRCGVGGGGVMSKNPQYLFSPVLPSSEPSACLLPSAGATTLLFAKAKTLQEKTPEYISQH